MAITLPLLHDNGGSFPLLAMNDQQALRPQLLVSSPYTGDEHHLDVSSLPKSSQQVATALSSLRPVTDDYPSDPYSTSFNWQEVIDQLPSEFTGTLPLPMTLTFSGQYFCIAFYSTLRAEADIATLHYFDSLAHSEANEAGGLLKYWWQNIPDPSTRKNLATCVWVSWDHAKTANRLPMHARAMSVTRDSYEKWNVERYYLNIYSGHKWELERISL